MSIINFANDFELFNHENLGSVRALTDEQGNVWFVAKDVCDVLEIANSRDALSRLDSDEKTAVGITDTSSNGVVQRRTVNIINEIGMYSLVLTSRKPQAKEFKRWLIHDVIPAIRQHGGYVYGQEKLLKEEQFAVEKELEGMAVKLKKLRVRRHELIREVKHLKEERKNLKKECRTLNEYSNLFEDMFERAQSDYEKAVEENEALRTRIEKMKHPEQFADPGRGPKMFVAADGVVVSSELWSILNEDKSNEEYEKE